MPRRGPAGRELYHFLRVEHLVEAFCGQEAQLDAGFFQGDVFGKGGFCGFGCVFVADVGIRAVTSIRELWRLWRIFSRSAVMPTAQ